MAHAVGWRSLEGGEVTGPRLHQLLVICFDGAKSHCEPRRSNSSHRMKVMGSNSQGLPPALFISPVS